MTRCRSCDAPQPLPLWFGGWCVFFGVLATVALLGLARATFLAPADPVQMVELSALSSCEEKLIQFSAAQAVAAEMEKAIGP